MNNINFKFDDIKSCELTGVFSDDEYVYDIEVDDETHTFICNDILVHNSAYITFQPLVDAYEIPIEQQIDFCLAVYEAGMADFLEDVFDKYAAKFNCKKNLEKFELEKISRTIIMLAKKNYMCDVAWVDSPAYFDPLHHITYTGFDVVKGITPEFCRKCMKDFTEFCFSYLNKGQTPSYDSINTKIKEYKMKFVVQPPDEISRGTNLSGYNEYILNDKTLPIKYQKIMDPNDKRYGEDVVCPIHVRASAVYNNLLYTTAKKYRSKYQFIKKGDKVNFYYTSPDEVFAFIPGNYPIEFAPKMDTNVQFEKMILNPLNRIISALGYPPVTPRLTYSQALF